MDYIHAQGAQSELKLDVREIRLNNGMRFLLVPRPQAAPVFTAYIRVKVGAMDEPLGKTGLAHMLEHMAFKGTTEIDDKEFTKIYHRNGGLDLNATTGQDLTSYFVSMPSEKLELWAYMESARLTDPVFRDFVAERDVVMEERRMRVDDSPVGFALHELAAASFEQNPYRRPTIGTREDIQNYQAEDLKKFYDTYYDPANMVGVIVGHFDPAQATQYIRQYFSSIKNKSGFPTQRIDHSIKDEEQTATKNIRVNKDSKPYLLMTWRRPSIAYAGEAIYDMLYSILCDGSESRLYQELVVNKQLAYSVDCASSYPGSRVQNLFLLMIALRDLKDAKQVEQHIQQSMQQYALQGFHDDELRRAKIKNTTGFYYKLQSNEEMADSLSFFEIMTGSWRYILDYPKKNSTSDSRRFKK